MLKIKDNVDLKELEKFGFNIKPYNNYYTYNYCDEYIWIDKYTKVIDYTYHWLGFYHKCTEIPNMPHIKRIMNKLKKVGLIEKVGE